MGVDQTVRRPFQQPAPSRLSIEPGSGQTARSVSRFAVASLLDRVGWKLRFRLLAFPIFRPLQAFPARLSPGQRSVRSSRSASSHPLNAAARGSFPLEKNLHPCFAKRQHPDFSALFPLQLSTREKPVPSPSHCCTSPIHAAPAMQA